jgi:hypothetical protein
LEKETVFSGASVFSKGANMIPMEELEVRKNASFLRHFVRKTIDFAKIGSGQTQEKLGKTHTHTPVL